MNTRIVFVSILIFLSGYMVQAANASSSKVAVDSALLEVEHQLNELSQQLYNTRRNDDLSMALSDSMLMLLQNAYTNPNAYTYPFDSLKGLGKIESEKNEVRIFTWNIVLRTGEYKYYGFLHYNNKNIQKTFVLNDASDSIADNMSITLGADMWLGANYYEIVERKNSQGVHYVLLGWHGHNLHINKKIIETLYFTQSGKPKFGKSLIKVQKKKYKRIVFQYSRMANMMITYNANMDMIVMDHLSPPSSVQIGDFKSYGPDLSYDGLEYNGEFWEYKETIDFKRTEEKRKRRR